jgi:chromosome segregation ATPase
MGNRIEEFGKSIDALNALINCIEDKGQRRDHQYQSIRGKIDGMENQIAHLNKMVQRQETRIYELQQWRDSQKDDGR